MRIGINNVSLGYVIGDVVLVISFIEVVFKSINYESGGKIVLIVFDKGDFENLFMDFDNLFF